jgi:hypothetical protein
MPAISFLSSSRWSADVVRHPKSTAWEARLKAVFDRIDDDLEARYGADYALHPSRPPRGATANREADGLFNVGAAFTPGYGSRHGRGYTVRVHMATLEHVPEAVRTRILDEVVDQLRERLPAAFPDRTLQVSRDGSVYRIHGDLRLT